MTEYVEAIQERYRGAGRPGKRLLLDVFVQVGGNGRKLSQNAVRFLSHPG